MNALIKQLQDCLDYITLYSEDQPRDEAGRWTAEGGDAESHSKWADAHSKIAMSASKSAKASGGHENAARAHEYAAELHHRAADSVKEQEGDKETVAYHRAQAKAHMQAARGEHRLAAKGD